MTAKRLRNEGGYMSITRINQRLRARALDGVTAAYNTLVGLRSTGSSVVAEDGPISEINRNSRKRSDVSDHLTTLFLESVAMRPSMIVELGVRSGESTIAFSQVADLFESHLISVDLDDCSQACQNSRQVFVKSDDVKFAQEFNAWCESRNFPTAIDVLFIDTSHEFEHTAAEIENWFPHLSPHSKVLFHDTNMSTVYFRKDRTMGIGWENKRGVIAAIEQYLGCEFDERHDFVHYTRGWLVKHSANCNGLTVLERVCMAVEAPTSAGGEST
jgi:cephalosporin hydroxylase